MFFGVILLDVQSFTIEFNNVFLYFQSVWKQCCSSTIWGTVLKYKCIYNIVIPVVYNMCTQCILAGPLGQATERQLPGVQKVLSDIQYNVYKSSWFLHIQPSIHPSIHPSSHIAIYPSIYPSIHLSVHVRTFRIQNIKSTHTYNFFTPVLCNVQEASTSKKCLGFAPCVKIIGCTSNIRFQSTTYDFHRCWSTWLLFIMFHDHAFSLSNILDRFLLLLS